MAKGSKGRKSNNKTPQKPPSTFSDFDMDDEIDAFHKQRDVVPLDLDDDIGESDEEDVQHVFPIEDGSGGGDDEYDSEDDTQLTGFAAKIAKQHKSLQAKIGGVMDETHDDAEDEENKGVGWGRHKNIYYNNSKGESSDDEEEAEVLRLQNEKTRSYSNADHGLEDDHADESEGEPTFEENLRKRKVTSKATVDNNAQDEMDTGYEVVMKDPNALSKEEQMDIVYNSAPELVGLLSELNDTVEQLETKVDPILSKLKEVTNLNKTGIQYVELKKQLLLSYCQAITFHLLLKSEGHPVCDHPVLSRFLEIKNLLDKMKALDESLSFEVEDFLNKLTTTTAVNPPEEVAIVDSISLTTVVSSETQKEPHVETKFLKMDHEKRGKRKRQNEQLGLQSVEMLKVRAALEEKLKHLKAASRSEGIRKKSKPLNGKLEALDDFNDDIEGSHADVSRLVTRQMKKPRVISGDDDLPKRDDIGERRRKHETRVLASAGIKSEDDSPEAEANEVSEGGGTDSELDLYQEMKTKREAKLANKYSRSSAPSVVSGAETLLDGKRHINYEMEKNRGLTRKRNKDTKNPRKKYKLKHKKKEVARKGQVRAPRKPTGPYGGEGSGINTISRSIRFKT